jgi:hypothetical protein
VTIAYLDPGSGSLLVSAVVGGAAAAGVAVKQARHRIASKLSRKRRDPEVEAGLSAGTDATDTSAEGSGAADVEAPSDASAGAEATAPVGVDPAASGD